jgi:hypothetical protein
MPFIDDRKTPEPRRWRYCLLVNLGTIHGPACASDEMISSLTKNHNFRFSK